MPQHRKSIRSDGVEQVDQLNHNPSHLQTKREIIMEENELPRRRKTFSGLPEHSASSKDGSINYDAKMTEVSDEFNEKIAHSSRNRSRTISSDRRDSFSIQSRKSYQSPINKQAETTKRSTSQTINNSFYLLAYGFMVIFVGLLVLLVPILFKIGTSGKPMQPINNAKSVLFEAIEDVKTRFHNQESDIWNDISSGINEVVSRTPKVPSIILLFGNETVTMNCLARALADVSSTILGTDSPLYLNPEDFGDDPGEIINMLSKRIPTRKVVIIHNVLNINARAIKALHNLCDRINPLVGEAIYIITMPTKVYVPSQKKLAFVEKQIYKKLSQNIDEDILMALITRITDGAIVSVQSEPNLRYC